MKHPPSDRSVSPSQALPIGWISHALSPKFGNVQRVETVKQRPWSEVYRIVAERGTSYFKICGPVPQYEVALIEWLPPNYRGILPEMIALSAERGWMLMADAGIPFRDLPSPESHSPELEQLLATYAQVQQYSLEHIDDLLAMQLPDRRLDQLSQLTESLVETGREQSWLDEALSSQVLDTLPALESLCSILSTVPYAAALDHGDLHTGNVLVRDNQLRICDWGDVCITHPFCSLLPLVEKTIGPQFSTVRDVIETDIIQAYLQSWNGFAPFEVLKSDAERAICIAFILRAMDMAHMLKRADADAFAHWSPFMAQCLSRWVQLEETMA
jgi:hypothetical protein